MVRKSNVSPAKLEEIERLQTAAEAASAAAKEAEQANAMASGDLKKKLIDLRERIATGYTTGEHLLDINIVVNSSVTKDERYDAMVEFEKILKANAGKLIAIGNSGLSYSTPQVQTIGVVPENPFLQLRVGGAFGRGRVFGGDSSVQVAFVPSQQAGTAHDYFVLTWGGTRDKTELGSNVFFEDKLQWILENEPNMNLAVKLWSQARALGRPLAAPKQVMEEIIARRENLAIDLHSATESLRSATQELEKSKNNRQQWTSSQIEEDGQRLIITFPNEISNIKRSRKNLAIYVKSAADLGMNEPASACYKKALAQLALTMEFED